MPGLVRAGFYVALTFLVALIATVATRLLVGGINTRNLLYGRRAGDVLYFSPERIQLLLFTLWTASSYLLGVVETRGSGKLPDIPSTTLALLGGSHALYLGGKAYSMLLSRLPKGDA